MKELRTRGWKPNLPWLVRAWRDSPTEEKGYAKSFQSAPNYEAALEKRRELINAGWESVEIQESR